MTGLPGSNYSVSCGLSPGREVINFFMLSSAEHELDPAFN